MAEVARSIKIIPSAVERGILVENIPYIVDDAETLKDKLTIYFQGAASSNGEVERIVCRLGGNINTAIVVFKSIKDAMMVMHQGEHKFADELLHVSKLPPVFKHVSAHFEVFYWTSMVKSKSKEVTKEIIKMLPKSSYEKKPQGIAQVECNLNQLQEVQSKILNAGPLSGFFQSNLVNKTTQEDIVERTIAISGIPYLTDDKETLKANLQTYFKRVVKKEVQELVCGIRGDLKKALAIFHTIEDMNFCLSVHEKGDDDVRFLEEALTVKKLPQVISEVTAKCDDFYFKLMPKNKRSEMKTVMLEQCGSDLTKDGVIVGSLHQACMGRAIILETLGLQQREDSREGDSASQYPTEEQRSENKASRKEYDIDERYSATSKDEATSDSLIGATSPQMDLVIPDHELDAAKDTTNGKLQNYEYEEDNNFKGISKHPGKAVKQGHEKVIQACTDQKHGSEVDLTQPKDRELKQKIGNSTLPDEVSSQYEYKSQAKQRGNMFETGFKSTGRHLSSSIQSTEDSYKHQQAQKNQNQTGRQQEERYFDANENFNPDFEGRNVTQGTDMQLRASNGSDVEVNSGGESNLLSKNDIIEPPSEELEQGLCFQEEGQDTSASSQYKSGTRRHVSSNTNQAGFEPETDSISSADVSSKRLLDEELPETTGEEENECAQVDKVKFEYVATKKKEAYDMIKKSHGVSITAKSKNTSKPNELVVEVKRLGRASKRKGKKDEVLEAQKQFISLYSETISSITTRCLDCSAVKPAKLTKAKEMLKKRFTDILLVKEKTQYIFCGKESTVVDGIAEFRKTAGMGDENSSVDEPLSVDKIAFQYLKQNSKDELDALEQKYNVYLELRESTQKSPEEQQILVKPKQSGKQKRKVTAEEIGQAKDAFITLYQSSFYAMKRVQLTCQGVTNEVIREAMTVTKQNFPGVLFLKREGDDYLICGEESVIQNAVKEFRRASGILPPSRKLKKTNSSETASSKSDTNSSNELPKEQITAGATGTGQSHCVSENLPSVFVTKEGLEVIVLKGDITKQEVNVIVNAANERLKHAGGVAKAIAKGAGPELQKESYALMRGRQNLKIGECVETKGYNLQCDSVVHTVGPVYNKQEQNISTFFEYLKMTFLNVLMYADGKNDVKTIAVPLISSGNYGGPKESCTDALAAALFDFSRMHDKRNLKQVFLVNIDEAATLAIQQTMIAKFPPIPDKGIPDASKASDQTQTMQTVRTLKTKEGLEVVIAQGDITKCEVSVIVNAANGHLRHGRGVAAAISKAAGKQFQEECDRLISSRKRQPFLVGEIAETNSYKLPCKTVLHAVGPRFSECSSTDVFCSSLKQTFLAVLKHANMRVEVPTIAIPLISSGIFGGSKQLCSKALVEAVNEFSEKENTLITKTVYLVNIDAEATKAIDEAFQTSHPMKWQATTQENRTRESDFETLEGVKICVEKADITKQSTEAIVNPTNCTLSHTGGVSKAISNAAGTKLQTECREKIKSRKYLQPAEVLHTSGGNLPCQYVLHVISPFFNSSLPSSEYSDALKSTVIACLREANNSLKLRSVAVPLIGSGQNAAPLDLCATALAKAIEAVSGNEKTLLLKQITVVSTDDKAIRAVYQAFGQHFQARNSEKQDNSEKPSMIRSDTNINAGQTTEDAQSRDVITPVCVCQTNEGIKVIVECGNFTQQTVDILIVSTDAKLNHHEDIAQTLHKAAGPALQKECDGLMKYRKHIKPGGYVTTGGHNLPCKRVLHYAEQTELIYSESSLLSILFYTKITLRAKSAAFLVNSSSGKSAEALANALKRFSKEGISTSLQTVYVVGINVGAVSTVADILSRHLKVVQSISRPVNTAKTVTQPSVPTDQHVPLSQQYLNQTQSNFSHYQGTTSGCQKCYGTYKLKKIESCGHIFCPSCIKNHISNTSSCFICKAFYCVAEEKTLHGTMTYYYRADIMLGGSSKLGAICIVYEFPPGTQGANHPRPGEPYYGTKAMAYLPYDVEGCEIVKQFRTAFVAGLTFDVKPNRHGKYEVAWSDLIPHKRNPQMGKSHHGYPDSGYMAEVKAALDRELKTQDRKRTDDTKGKSSWV